MFYTVSLRFAASDVPTVVRALETPTMECVVGTWDIIAITIHMYLLIIKYIQLDINMYVMHVM